MTAPAGSVPGSGAPAADDDALESAAAPVAADAPKPAPTLTDAFARARELVAQRQADAAVGAPMGETEEERVAREAVDAELANETAEERTARETAEAQRASETPEQTTAREAQEAAAAAELVVAIPPRREGEEPFEIEVSDKEAADRLRQLAAAAVRGDQARAIRDEAQAMRDRAEELQLDAELDPAGFIRQVMTKPQDVDHLIRYLLTRDGVMARARDWISGLIETPESVALQQRLVDADDVKRRDSVARAVAVKREVNENARQIVRTLDKSIESMLPATFIENDDAKGIFRNDLLSDIRAYARFQVQRDPDARTVDPRVIPGLVERRRKLLGLAAPSATAAPAAAPTPAGSKAPAATTGPTAEQLKQARAKRRAAASAPPGAGSQVATMQRPPKYDPKQKGTAINQAATYARSVVAALRKRPQ